MAQLRHGYPLIRETNTEILQITHNTLAEARLYFQRYLLVFPYLCDAERAVHARYGLPMDRPTFGEGARILLSAAHAATSDLVLRGERTASPMGFFQRYKGRVSPQAVIVVDREGIVRFVHVTGPSSSIPPVADLVRELANLA
jgi:hypothetical protein